MYMCVPYLYLLLIILITYIGTDGYYAILCSPSAREMNMCCCTSPVIYHRCTLIMINTTNAVEFNKNVNCVNTIVQHSNMQLLFGIAAAVLGLATVMGRNPVSQVRNT